MGAMTSTVCVLHLGKSGAGPRLQRDFVNEISRRPGYDVCAVYSSNSEVAAAIGKACTRSVSVRTYQSALGVVTGLPRLLWAGVRARQMISGLDNCVVFSPMYSIWESIIVGVLVPRGTPFLYSVHDPVQHAGEENRLLRWIQDCELAAADAVMTYSHSVASSVAKSGYEPSRIFETVHPTFGSEEKSDAAAVRPWDRSGRLVIGMFGRLSRYKGIDLFLEAVEICRRRGLDVVGRVVGSGLEDEDRYVREFPEVEWQLGWVSEEEVNSVVRGFDVLALPYIEASQSGVFAVSLAEGVPVAATPVGGLEEQVRNAGAGLVSDSVTAEAFADVLGRLAESESLRLDLGRKARAAAAGEFSLWRVVDDVLRACDSLLSSRRAVRRFR